MAHNQSLDGREGEGHTYGIACGITDDPDCPEWPIPESRAQVERRKEGERLAGLLRRYWPEVEPVLLELLAPEIGRLVSQLTAKPPKRRTGR